MTKFQLDVEYDYDFDLIGISCHVRDYRLSWAINTKLGIGLAKKKEDIEITTGKKKKEIHHHSVYEFMSEEDHVEYQLVLNKNGASLLLPEQKMADYLFVLRNNFAVELESIISKIKEIDIVLTAFPIDVSTLRSKENLIF